jgi:hypothetical protein
MTNPIPNDEDYNSTEELLEAFHNGTLDNNRTQMLRSIMDLLSIVGRFYKGSNEITKELIIDLCGSYIVRCKEEKTLPNIDMEVCDD